MSLRLPLADAALSAMMGAFAMPLSERFAKDVVTHSHHEANVFFAVIDEEF
jgi:hypothetical protein